VDDVRLLLHYGAEDVVFDCWQFFNVQLEDMTSSSIAGLVVI